MLAALVAGVQGRRRDLPGGCHDRPEQGEDGPHQLLGSAVRDPVRAGRGGSPAGRAAEGAGRPAETELLRAVQISDRQPQCLDGSGEGCVCFTFFMLVLFLGFVFSLAWLGSSWLGLDTLGCAWLWRLLRFGLLCFTPLVVVVGLGVQLKV